MNTSSISVNTNKAMRAVVLRHPNSVECAVFRKTVRRVDDQQPGTMGGRPTLGGMGLISSEDEDDFDIQPLGDAYLLPCEAFQPSTMNNRDDGMDAADGVMLYCMIEPEANPGSAAYFDLEKNDYVFLVVWDGIYMGYEIVGVETTINIPPFTRRYMLNKRDDLNYLELQPEV